MVCRSVLNRYADLAVDSKRNKIFAICESHSEGGGEPKNELVSIGINTPAQLQLATGACDRITIVVVGVAFLCFVDVWINT